MENPEFYVAFTGPAARFPVLSRFFDRLVSVKAAMEQIPAEHSFLNSLVSDPTWIELLDSEAFEKVTDSASWEIEDVLASVLNGEYQLLRLTFDGQAGELVYDPWAYPFGGTDPLKALICTFGFEVSRDSFWDGFAESQQQ